MKFALVLTLIMVLLTITLALPAKGSTKPSLKKKTCVKACTDDYTPVCGGDDAGKKISFGNECVLANYNCENNASKFILSAGKKISFGNECVLANYNCENNANLKLVSKGECPGSQGVRLS
ncbi:Kazal-type serine protease inhibitor domain [Popillia japonica]|uniref:Kazal-type serine protease inhibitor domain n=1 Tax=Popillia japonica TaxID=7064 RepID=A0AAW1MIX8_POPJA